ncbi:MAG: hypothetical protein ACNI25_10615 [Halarcobacter sp.]
MTIDSYFKELNEAIDFTDSMGLKLPKKINFDYDKRYFTEEGNYKLIKVYNDIFQSKLINVSDMYEFALGMIANCSPLHYFLKKYLDKELGCKSYFTIGYILFDDEKGNSYHKITQEIVKDCLNNSKFPKDHHVWLTLDSGEILDLTFPLTYSSIHDKNFNNSLEQGKIGISFINRHINDFQHSMTYKPILIGENFFSKIGFDLEDISYVMYNKYII